MTVVSAGLINLGFNLGSRFILILVVMKKNRGIAVIPLIIVIVLVGVAGFSIFSWVKTKNQAQAAKEVAEQREKEFKAALDDAQQEAEDNAKKASDLQDTLTKTEEAMKLAEEKAQQDAEEKAAMLAELETKLEEEAAAKQAAEEKTANLNEEIASLEKSIADAREREYSLRASLGGTGTAINPKVYDSLSGITGSVSSQKDKIRAIKGLLSGTTGTVAKVDLEELIRSYEDGLIEAEKNASGLKRDLIDSGEFSSSSSVGQAVYDLQQTTRKQRSILNGLKSLLAGSGETIDAAQISTIISDLEASISELEARQSSLDNVLNAQTNYAGDGSAALASFEQTIKKSQEQLEMMKRQLAVAESEKQAALDRQKQLERLSIEIRYDIDYQARSLSYARRLHSMYNRVAHPKEER